MDDYHFTSQFPKSEQPSSSESGQRNISLAEAIDNFYEDERARGLLPLTVPCLQNRLGLGNRHPASRENQEQGPPRNHVVRHVDHG